VLAFGAATAAPAGGRPGGGLVVNVSRGIARAAFELAEGAANGVAGDLGDRLAEAARTWSERLPVLPSGTEIPGPRPA
jgi:hypothetical protein